MSASDAHAVLMMARAGGVGGYELTDLCFEQEVRGALPGLEAQGFLIIRRSETEERIFITPAGFERSAEGASA